MAVSDDAGDGMVAVSVLPGPGPGPKPPRGGGGGDQIRSVGIPTRQDLLDSIDGLLPALTAASRERDALRAEREQWRDAWHQLAEEANNERVDLVARAEKAEAEVVTLREDLDYIRKSFATFVEMIDSDRRVLDGS